MTDNTTFSSRSNAKRAAEKAIRTGTAQSIDYGIKPNDKDRYRFEIVWHLKGDGSSTSAASQVIAAIEEESQEQFDPWESEAAAMDPFARIEASDEIEDLGTTPEKYDFKTQADAPAEASDGEQTMAERYPPGTRVIVQVSKRKRSAGTVDYRVDATTCRVKFDGPHPSVLHRYSELSLDDGAELAPPAGKTERRKTERQSGARKPSKSAEMDAAAARGEMPAKPIITSKANRDQYQKRFDQLEAWARALLAYGISASIGRITILSARFTDAPPTDVKSRLFHQPPH